MEETDYVHITFVKQSELSMYQKNWPNHVFVVLPPDFDDASFGAVKQVMKVMKVLLAIVIRELIINRQLIMFFMSLDCEHFLVILVSPRSHLLNLQNIAAHTVYSFSSNGSDA